MPIQKSNGRRKRTDSRAPHPGAARVTAGRPNSSAAARSVYSGQDRCGHYTSRNGAWFAFDRRGKELGVYPNEGAAIDAIEAAAGAAFDQATTNQRAKSL
jgi:hypothetical protein